MASALKIGVLHSLSGPMALSEAPLVDAALLAVQEINAEGGVLGRQLQPVILDGASDDDHFAHQALRLIQGQNVAAIFGCWTSSARKAVRQVVEEHDHLLWYPVQYEGLEQSPAIVYTGSCLNQQIAPAISWCLQQGMRRFFLLGSEYIFPRTANRLARAMLDASGAEIAGELYAPLSCGDFASHVDALLQARPDVVLNTVNGESNISLFQQLARCNDAPAPFPLLSFSLSETELQQIGESAQGHLACWSYFQSLDTPANKDFLARYRKAYGVGRVVSDPIVTAYAQVHLWKAAVERSGETNPERLKKHLQGCSIQTPLGELEIQPNNHVARRALMGKATSKYDFQVVWQSPEQFPPRPWLGVEDIRSSTKPLLMELLQSLPHDQDYKARLEHEVADHKRTSQALAQSQERMAALLDALPDTLFMFDASFTFTNCQASDPDLLLLPPEQFIGRHVRDVLPPDLAELTERMIQGIQSDGQARHYHYSLPISGQLRHFETRLVPAGDNEFLAIVQDATQKIEALDALKESEELWRLTLSNVSDTVIMTNDSGAMTFVCPNVHFIFGYSQNEVQAFPDIFSLFKEECSLRQQLVDFDKELTNIHCTVIDKQGRSHDVLVSVKHVDIKGNKLLFTMHEATELLQYQRELLEARKRAEAASQAKSEFLANMSHEIRTPLNGVMGMLHLLQLSTLEQQQQEYVGMAIESCRRLSGLLTDILDLSKIEAGKMAISSQSFTLHSVLVSVENIFALQAREKGIKFNIHCDAEASQPLLGDAQRLRQILFNLVGNAVKFTHEGEVTVRVRPLRASDEKHSLDRVTLEFTVADTGIGMPQELAKDMFEPFTQAEHSMTRSYQGAGLGLAIVRRLVAIMGGDIHLQSQEGAGTSIHCTLSFNLGQAAGDAPEAAPPLVSYACRKVLVAEDDDVNALMIRRLLERLGLQVELVSNGLDAVRLLEETPTGTPFDLVFMDIEMPGMDGLEATKLLRQSARRPELASLPVVALTAYAMEGDRERFLAAGMDAYLSKPLDLMALQEVLARYCKGK